MRSQNLPIERLRVKKKHQNKQKETFFGECAQRREKETQIFTCTRFNEKCILSHKRNMSYDMKSMKK